MRALGSTQGPLEGTTHASCGATSLAVEPWDAEDLPKRYMRDGVVAVSGLFAPDEIRTLTRAAEIGLKRRRDDADDENRGALARQFDYCFNLWEESAEIRRVVAHPRLGALAARLLGSRTVRLFVDQTFFKEPGAEATSKHQDCTRWPAQGPMLTAWIALDDVTMESGALGYVLGSHHAGYSSWRDLATGRRWSVEQMSLIDRPPVFAPARRGDVLLHDSRTFHLSTPNDGATRRRAFAVVYSGEGARRVSHLPFPTLDWDGVAVGAPLEGPRAPQTFPPCAVTAPPPPPERLPGWPAPREAGG